MSLSRSSWRPTISANAVRDLSVASAMTSSTCRCVSEFTIYNVLPRSRATVPRTATATLAPKLSLQRTRLDAGGWFIEVGVPRNQFITTGGNAAEGERPVLRDERVVRGVQYENDRPHEVVDLAVHLHDSRLLERHTLGLAGRITPEVETLGFRIRKHVVEERVLVGEIDRSPGGGRRASLGRRPCPAAKQSRRNRVLPCSAVRRARRRRPEALVPLERPEPAHRGNVERDGGWAPPEPSPPFLGPRRPASSPLSKAWLGRPRP